MDDREKTDGQGGTDKPDLSDSELSGRLRGLGSALQRVQAERRAEEADPKADPTSTASGMALAFRLGAEFVAGVLVGAGLGWGIDYLFGIAPWGMIVFLLLGFGASVVNMMRAAGEFGRKTPPKGGA
ncbi:AtpZ/AtpI family protein [Ancylobacter defluvii]|uniref:ATP synthase protein I n=1 Tax=Ancylobacter defluvii TaxID=1282440 RepID=A0A9W6NC58_9HYPH|nr:AtpZ/AtpI family protein [Ancylobacter defluvii]MBS7589668.1 AtpZ/AtpI family protein [Ancylobacter defluvii]GLK85287.1 ATP synthase protein I [Ancylobacter defluvii]